MSANVERIDVAYAFVLDPENGKILIVEQTKGAGLCQEDEWRPERRLQRQLRVKQKKKQVSRWRSVVCWR